MSTSAKQHPGWPDAVGFVRAVLAAALAQVQSHVDAVDAGSMEAERIHQLRVALRRLRTVLRECAGLAPGMRAEWDEPLAQAFAQLGTLRDADTLADVVRPLLQAAHAPLCDWQAPEAIETDAAAAVREPRFLQALAGIPALPGGLCAGIRAWNVARQKGPALCRGAGTGPGRAGPACQLTGLSLAIHSVLEPDFVAQADSILCK
jgi:hypothetical protein